MKLARPDLFHPRIVLAGDPEHSGGGDDDAGLVEALRSRGLSARWRSWDDPDTLRADLVILRATRDYAPRRRAFLAWTRRVRNLLNPPNAVAWNASRRYLTDLRRAGVRTVPQRAPGDTTALVFLGGQQSHAFGGVDADPDVELWDLGREVVHAAASRVDIGVAELLYARVDVVGGRERLRLAGLDLIAPPLGWGASGSVERDERQRRFAVCVESALQRFGLGPLSHGRP